MDYVSFLLKIIIPTEGDDLCLLQCQLQGTMYIVYNLEEYRKDDRELLKCPILATIRNYRFSWNLIPVKTETPSPTEFLDPPATLS